MRRGMCLRKTTCVFMFTVSLVIVLFVFQVLFREHSTVLEVTISTFNGHHNAASSGENLASPDSSSHSSSSSSFSSAGSARSTKFTTRKLDANTTACVEKMRHTVLPERVRHMALELLALVLTALEQAGVNYVLDAGTLIGSYRHHCLIPWDDDFDLLIDERDRAKFEALFKPSSANTSKASGGGAGRLALADLYMSRMDANRCFKIYTRHGIPGHPYGSFPFVDAVITRHLSASTVGYFQYKIDRAHLWPAVRRPFCGLYPYVPRHSRRYLEILYGKDFMDRCVYTNHPHYRIAHRPGCEAPCDKLRPHLPFVYRSAVNMSVEIEHEGNQNDDNPATDASVHHLSPTPALKAGVSYGSSLLSPGHNHNSSISYTFRPELFSAQNLTSTTPSAMTRRGQLMRLGKATLERLMVGDKLIGEYLVEELE